MNNWLAKHARQPSSETDAPAEILKDLQENETPSEEKGVVDIVKEENEMNGEANDSSSKEEPTSKKEEPAASEDMDSNKEDTTSANEESQQKEEEPPQKEESSPKEESPKEDDSSHPAESKTEGVEASSTYPEHKKKKTSLTTLLRMPFEDVHRENKPNVVEKQDDAPVKTDDIEKFEEGLSRPSSVSVTLTELEPMENFNSLQPPRSNSHSAESRSRSSSSAGGRVRLLDVPPEGGELTPNRRSSSVISVESDMLDLPEGMQRLRSDSATMEDLLPRFRRNSRAQLDKIGRIPIREGQLFRVTKKGPKPYIFHLFNDALAYSEDKRKGLKVQKIVEMSHLELSDMDDYKIGKKDIQFAFSIKTNEEEFVVCAPSQELKEVWMFDIIKCVTPYLTDQHETHGNGGMGDINNSEMPEIDDFDILSDDDAEQTAISEKIVEIEKEFKGHKVKLQKPGRRFIREGQLHRVTRKGIKKFIFHLFNDILVYSEKTPLGLKLHRILELCSLVITDQDDEQIGSKEMKYVFTITSDEKSFVVGAPSQDDKEMWMMDITRCIAPFLGDTAEKVAEKQKNQAPVWVNNKSSNKCQLCARPFSAFNRKHHCRKCGTLCCSDCSPDRRIVPNINAKKAVRVCIWCVEDLPTL